MVVLRSSRRVRLGDYESRRASKRIEDIRRGSKKFEEIRGDSKSFEESGKSKAEAKPTHADCSRLSEPMSSNPSSLARQQLDATKLEGPQQLLSAAEISTSRPTRIGPNCERAPKIGSCNSRQRAIAGQFAPEVERIGLAAATVGVC